MTFNKDSAFAIIEDTLTHMDKTTELIEDVLDTLMTIDLNSVSTDVKDELYAKLQTAQIILLSIDDQLQHILPNQKFSKVWSTNINGIKQFLNELPSPGHKHIS